MGCRFAAPHERPAIDVIYSLGMATLIPPSAITIAPTMKLAFAEARNATTSAISSGRAARLIGAFILDSLYGPIYHRMLVPYENASLNGSFVEAVVEITFKGLRSKG